MQFSENYNSVYLQEQNGKVLDQWTIASRDEEQVIIQQFLRFGETKSIAQEIILQETRDCQEMFVKQTSRNESEIKKFIERSSFPMQGFMRPFDPRHLFGGRLPFVPPGARLLSPGLPGFSPPTSRDLRPPVITVGSTSPGTTSPLGRLQTMQPFDFRHESASPSISPGQIVSDKPPIRDHSPCSESPQNLSITSTSSTSVTPPFTPQKSDSDSPMSKMATTAALSLSAPAMMLPVLPRPDDDGRVLNFSTKDHGVRHHSSIFADKKIKHLRKSSNPIKRQWLPTNSFGTTMIGPNGKKRVLCTACNKTFCDKGALKIHYSAVHLKEMHKCSVEGCTMMFSSRRSRNRHSANPNPKLHMPQKRPKMPDGVTIIDDGSGTPTRPITSPPPTMIHTPNIMASHSPINMESPEPRPFYSEPNLQLPLFPTMAKRLKLDFDDYDDGPKDLSLPLIRREQAQHADSPMKESPDSSSDGDEKQENSNGSQTQRVQSRRKNIPSRCAQPSDLYMVTDDYSDDKDPEGKGLTRHPMHSVDQNGCSSPRGMENENRDQQYQDEDRGKKCDSSTGQNEPMNETDIENNMNGPFEKNENVTDGALDFSKHSEVENEDNLSVDSDQDNDNSQASNESEDFAKSNGDLSADFEIPIDKDDPRKCTSCGKSFLNHFTLKIHYKNVHLKLLHNCTVEGCNAAFPSKRSRDRHASNLNLHRKLLSTSNKADTDDNQNFRADIIQKLYEAHNLSNNDFEISQNSSLNGHKNDETIAGNLEDPVDENEGEGNLTIDEGMGGEDMASVTCHICQTRVRDNLILKEHFETMHPKEMFPCTVMGCDKTFSTKKSRNHHSQNGGLHRSMSPSRRAVVV